MPTDAWTSCDPDVAHRQRRALQDYSDLIRRHREMDADITLCSCSVPREQASNRGLVRVDPSTGAALVLTAWCTLVTLVLCKTKWLAACALVPPCLGRYWAGQAQCVAHALRTTEATVDVPAGMVLLVAAALAGPESSRNEDPQNQGQVA